MKRATFVVTMMLLLASASVALPHDTAWVLWKNVEGKGFKDIQRTSWDLKGAMKTSSSCKAASIGALDATKSFWEPSASKAYVVPDHENPENSKLIVRIGGEGGGILTIWYICLPDTIDPREKK